MTVRLFGIEFDDEADRDRALRELQQGLDRVAAEERHDQFLRLEQASMDKKFRAVTKDVPQ